MLKKLTTVFMASCLVAGCASVPMESREVSTKAKSFASPSANNAGLYIYRPMGIGTALTKNIYVDGKCIGASAPSVFFYEEVEGNKDHKISTESQFSPNDLVVKTLAGQNYFIKQYMKVGVFVPGADLELMDPAQGRKDISGLEMAVKGNCK